MLKWAETARGNWTDESGRFYIASPMGVPIGQWILFDCGCYAAAGSNVRACQEYAEKLERIDGAPRHSNAD